MTDHRFVYLTEVDPSQDTGRGINEREFIQALRRNHAEQVVCVLPSPAQPETYSDPGIEYVHPHKRSSVHYFPHLVSSWRRIAALHRERPIDALVIRLQVTPVVAFRAWRRLGIPIVLKTLAMSHVFAKEHRGSRAHEVVSRAFAPMFRSVIENAFLADTVSPSFAEWLRHTFGLDDRRLRVIRNSANVDLFTPGDRIEVRRRLRLDRFDRIIGYVGSMGGIRYLDTLLLSFKDLRPRDGVGLVLVGDGPERPRLEGLARDAGLEDRVVFTGAVPYQAVPDYIRAFDVAVDLNLQTLAVGNRFVHLAISQKIGQYLGCGVPVVAWDVADNEFLAEEQVGTLVPFNDGPALTLALQSQIDADEERRQRRCRQARQFAESNLSADVLARRRIDWWRSELESAGAH